MPTHNRSQYAVHAITNVLSVKSSDLELVVHDSSDADDLEQWVRASVADPRLVYRHVRARLSITDNHNAAMALATGEYACLIGDDDGINPEILDAVRWAKANDVDALTPRIVANYCWPDFRTRVFGTRHASRLYVGRISGRWERLDVSHAFRECLVQACQGTGNLPKIYHGIVRRTCLQQLFESAGAYFFGVSPDVSGAIALAPYIQTYWVLDYPLTIPGASGKSNTGRSAMLAHVGTLEDDPHMKLFQNVVWPDIVPKFVSVETVWAQAGVAALQATGQDEALRHFDYVALHALCLWAHPVYTARTASNLVRILRAKRQKLAVSLARLVIAMGKVIARRILYLVRRLARPTASGGRDYVAHIANVEAAGRELQQYLRTRNRSFGGVLSQRRP
jgi:hypothetical protein